MNVQHLKCSQCCLYIVEKRTQIKIYFLILFFVVWFQKKFSPSRLSIANCWKNENVSLCSMHACSAPTTAKLGVSIFILVDEGRSYILAEADDDIKGGA